MSYGGFTLLPVILLTTPIVSRELICDEAIQECIDLVSSVQSEALSDVADTHRIYPVEAHLQSDPVNKSILHLGHLVLHTDSCVIRAHRQF